MFYITDRKSREELRSGMPVSFIDVFDSNIVKSNLNLNCSDDPKRWILDGDSDVALCLSLEGILRDQSSKIISKATCTLICNMYRMKYISPLFALRISKKKRDCIIEDDEIVKNEFRCSSIISGQGVVGAFMINLGEKEFWFEGERVKVGSITFIKTSNILPFENMLSNPGFQDVVLFLLFEKNGFLVKKDSSMFSLKETMDSSKIENIEEKISFDHFDIPMIVDVGLKYV